VIDEQMTELLNKISEDIHAIRLLTTRLVRDSYKKELERIANTPERREIWRLCDGTLSTREIAEEVGVAIRTVQYFLQEAEKEKLVVFLKRGYPKRTDDFDVVPPEWKSYKRPVTSGEGKQLGQRTEEEVA
jgi:hypothetical protein